MWPHHAFADTTTPPHPHLGDLGVCVFRSCLCAASPGWYNFSFLACLECPAESGKRGWRKRGKKGDGKWKKEPEQTSVTTSEGLVSQTASSTPWAEDEGHREAVVSNVPTVGLEFLTGLTRCLGSPPVFWHPWRTNKSRLGSTNAKSI